METSPREFWPYGLGAWVTCGTLAMAFTAAMIAVLFPYEFTVPDDTLNTMGLVPFWVGGKSAASTLVVSWLCVPGRLWSLMLSAPTTATQSVSPTAPTAQMAIMSTGWRVIHRATRYSSDATTRTPWCQRQVSGNRKHQLSC